MGKKTYQSGGKYAKQGSQPKKRRPRKPAVQMNTNAVAQQPATSDDAPAPVEQPVRQTPRRTDSTSSASTYSYVISDLKRTGIFAAVAFIILVILAIVL